MISKMGFRTNRVHELLTLNISTTQKRTNMPSKFIEYSIMKEMEDAGVVFNGGSNDRKLALRYSRVGKTFTITRKQRLDAYERALENTLENEEVKKDLKTYFKDK